MVELRCQALRPGWGKVPVYPDEVESQQAKCDEIVAELPQTIHDLPLPPKMGPFRPALPGRLCYHQGASSIQSCNGLPRKNVILPDGGIPPWRKAIAGAGPEVIMESKHDVRIIHHRAQLTFVKGVRAVTDQAAPKGIKVVAAFRSNALALAQQADMQSVDIRVQ